MKPLIAILVGLAAACGPDYLERERTESTLRHSFGQHGHAPAVVRCPRRKMAPGDRFACTAVLGKVELTIKVVQTEGEGAFEFALPFLPTDAIEWRAESKLQPTLGPSVTVECGRQAWLIEPGATHRCEITTNRGPAGYVVFTVVDASGRLEATWHNSPP